MWLIAWLLPLPALDGKVDRFAHVAAYTVIICARRQTLQTDLVLIGHRDQIPICVKQFEYDLLVALVLIDLGIKRRSPKLERRHNRRLTRTDRA